MVYKIYKLTFMSGIHIGRKELSETEISMCADTLFAAMCHEMVKKGEEALKDFVDKAQRGDIKITDALPYIDDIYYIPKPMMLIERNDKSDDSTAKKAYKKLAYIPFDKISAYVEGNLDAKEEEDKFSSNIGSLDVRTKVSINEEDKPEPYRVASFHFKENSGLYVIVGFKCKEDIASVDECFDSLGYEGIGGKRKAGLGRFSWVEGQISSSYVKSLTTTGKKYISLSCSLPREDEMEKALKDSSFILMKRSGFVASEKYSSVLKRKRDIFMFQAGSCFVNTFEGTIADVSDNGGHAVYRYAKPFFMEVLS